jgi:glycosyltransferase involved in cell wall biosynthesis
MANIPAISIGLPVYNGEKYLEICLRNLLEQTFEDFEIVISDNASVDRTRAICEEFCRLDKRIRYHCEEKNRGASWNFNRVLELSRGRYFKWAAYDDLVSPRYLEACLKALEENPDLVLAYGWTTIIDAEGKENDAFADAIHIDAPRPSDRLREYLYKVRLTNAIYGVVRTRIMRKTAVHQPYPGSDVVLLGELALWGKFREISEIHFFRRIHPLASAPANPSLQQLLAWYKPDAAGSPILPAWSHFKGYFGAIRRAPISIPEKLRCIAVLLNWRRYAAPELWREAQAAIHFQRSKGFLSLLVAAALGNLVNWTSGLEWGCLSSLE